MVQLRIKEILKDKKVTAKFISGEIGLSETSLSLIINGKQNPTLETLGKIANALDIYITDLFEPKDMNKKAIFKKIEVLAKKGQNETT